jgi:RimJ/RimL family protein N-acetyltransferase
MYNQEHLPVGYGALRLRNEGLFITECVGTKHRRQGYGLTILQELIQIASDEGRDLVAEIWATNISSIALHRRVGFEFESSYQKDGNELQRHRLRHQELARD